MVQATLTALGKLSKLTSTPVAFKSFPIARITYPLLTAKILGHSGSLLASRPVHEHWSEILQRSPDSLLHTNTRLFYIHEAYLLLHTQVSMSYQRDTALYHFYEPTTPQLKGKLLEITFHRIEIMKD